MCPCKDITLLLVLVSLKIPKRTGSILESKSSPGGVAGDECHVFKPRSWACPEHEFTSSASAVNEVTDLVEQRESLPVEGFRALMSQKDKESERDKK